MRERNHLRHYERRDGSRHNRDEEQPVAERVAQEAGDGACQHDGKVHDSGGDGVMRCLVPPRSHLLHHEERDNLHHESLAEAIDYDEGDVVPDVPFPEEVREHLARAVP